MEKYYFAIKIIWNAPQIFLEAQYLIRYCIVSLKNQLKKQKQILTAAVKTTPTKNGSVLAVRSKCPPWGCASRLTLHVCVCFWQMGTEERHTVLFLHSNKLETLPRRWDMQNSRSSISATTSSPNIISYARHNTLSSDADINLTIYTNHFTFIQNDYHF